MKRLARLQSWLRAVAHRSRLEGEIDDELRFHVEQQTADLIRGGLAPAEAARQARVVFGAVEARKEEAREALGLRLIDELRGDLRYALRQLRQSPGFTAVAVLSLALGIGANTAIFSLVNSLRLRALPVAEPQRLVTISSGTAVDEQWTYATWEQIRQRVQAFDGALAWAGERFNLAESGERDLVDGVFASGDFFTTLGVQALVGRTFTSADDVRGGGPDGPVAVISYGLWQRRFGGSANVIGTQLIVERTVFTIIGVTPPTFFGAEVGRAFDVALPVGTESLIRGTATLLDERRAYWLTAMLRLKSGQSLDAATATLRAMQPQIRDGSMPLGLSPQQEFMDDPFTLVPAAAGKSELRERYERPLLTILVVVALVLLIACANIANLLLARATTRRHELSVRLALGAPRWRLARQLLVESLVLAWIGAVVGLLFAAWGSEAIVSQLSTSVAPVVLDLSLDWRVMVFTAAIASATAVLFGTAPALRATRIAPIDALKEQGRSAGGRVTVSSGLVVAQVTLSLVLVVAAGLFVGTFERLATMPLGFDSDRVLVLNVNATGAGIDPAQRIPFYHRLVEAVAAVPGVAHAAASRVTPISGFGTNRPVDVPGAPPMSDRDRIVWMNVVTSEWFATYGTAILAGRDIDGRDAANAPPVIVVNESFVRKFFPDRSGIGRSVSYQDRPRQAPVPRTIVGVVGDAVYRSQRNGVQPAMYVPLAQFDPVVPLTDISISVRSVTGSPVPLARSVAAVLSAVDRDLAFSVRPLADQVNASLTQERLVAILSGFFGALALLLAGLGLYGVMSYAVSRRRTEIGIRMALGAAPSSVVRLVLTHVFVLIALGAVIGTGVSVWASRFVATLLYGLEPRDPATLVGAVVVLAAVGALAGWLPARRASRLDPMIALRHQ